ncbi:MAG: cupin domain-containing protein, partial [Methanosarcina sp.]|nr:cupin domain-containing protein [Methanosarcina sp.]
FLFNTSDEKCFSESSAVSEEFPCVVFRPDKSEIIEKHGVRMRIYTTKKDSSNAAVLYQETETGHAEEFVHEKSDFLYYILAGSGTWVVEDREFQVRAGDVVVVPAGKRFWFRGNLRQICITAPAWEEKYERHIRDIEL